MSRNEDERPDPDLLLKALKAESVKNRGGRLRIFFGMSAGVGKTYAMLEAARILLKEGTDVVMALVETHKRAETEVLLKGLPVLPRKKMEYRGKTFEEVDLDAVLERKPKTVIIDELAHTNVPGSRHAKRWQDIMEILDDGIDVYTTLNVQHIESRNEDVEVITGISVHETVPDLVLERASRIELIDLTPADLIARLKDGKVYLGEQAGRAVENFFKPDKLTALRELSLRVTGEIVNKELRNLTASGSASSVWRTSERLMVAVSPSPYSRQLIRGARRMAVSMEAPWFAVTVDTGSPLSDKAKRRLAENLELARKLGAEVVATADTDVVSGLKRAARQYGATQIIVGRPRSGWWWNRFQGGTLLDRFVDETNIDIYVLREHELIPEGRAANRPDEAAWDLFEPDEYWRTLWVAIGITALNAGLVNYLGYRSVGFVYLLAVMLISLFYGFGPIIFLALLSSFAWNFFFIPPVYTFHIARPDDIIMCAAYGVTAIITGMLAHKIRENERLLRQRELRNETMYGIVEIFALSTGRDEAIKGCCEKLGSALDGDCAVVFKNRKGELEELPSPFMRWFWDAKEWAVARWAFENNMPAGWSTDTLSMADALNIPLRGPSGTAGTLSFKPHNHARPLSPGEDDLLHAAAGQLAVYLEREVFQERARETKKLEQSERLHQTILNGISHEIKTPLTAIMGLSSALEDKKVSANEELRGQLLGELGDEVERLNTEINNILDMSRLSSGVLTLKKEWNDLQEIVNVCAAKLKKKLSGRNLKINIAEELPFVRVDFTLFEAAVTNLILNAVNYTPRNSGIEISAAAHDKELLLTVADNGDGLPEDQLVSVFDKFYRVPGSKAGGTGLGLSIAKSVVETHGGRITARNRSGGGLEVIITLPIEDQPAIGEEKKS